MYTLEEILGYQDEQLIVDIATDKFNTLLTASKLADVIEILIEEFDPALKLFNNIEYAIEKYLKNKNVKGFYYEWINSPNPRSTKKCKILRAYSGPASEKPKNFTSVNETQFKKVLEAVDKSFIYYGWTKPTKRDFN